jgi:hypothetical protein
MHARNMFARVLLGLWIVLALGLPAAIVYGRQSTVETAIYLPIIQSAAAQPAPLPSSVFGMVMTTIAPQRGLDSAAAAGVRWIRSNNNLLWRDVEPVEGKGYRWDAPSIRIFEQEILRANQQKLKFILVVRGSPRWATTPYKADCAPIHPDKYGRFASFLAAAVARYSKPPYNVTYWQIGNEPDAFIFSRDSGYGCWGVKTDPYYGGRAYGDMLKAVYPAIKAANPAVQVMHGSLLLDRPYNPEKGSGLSARFLEGVFLAGAANAFDILPYNVYFWGEDLQSPDWKTPYLQNLQQAYNVPPKPMMITEAGILCDPGCPLTQAYAVGRYYARGLANNLLGVLWYIYDSDDFHNTALIDPDNIAQSRPAYYAYKHAAAQLTGAAYAGALAGQSAGVEGYRFTRTDAVVIVLWADRARQVNIPVAQGVMVTCTAWDGGALPCSNASGTVALTADQRPMYVVIR